MARWEPGTPERLQQAALELFASRGFEQTTAADIARTVGLTERTFFRHFADKREVLFRGQDVFERAFLDVVARAEPAAPAMAVAVAAVLGAATTFPEDRRPFARARQSVIEANPSLRERERHKLAGLADALAAALRERGLTDPAVTLAAETGITVFRAAFAQWTADGETRPLDQIAAVVFGDLIDVVRAVAPDGQS